MGNTPAIDRRAAAWAGAAVPMAVALALLNEGP